MNNKTLFTVLGSVYVYATNDNGATWSQAQKLVSADGAADEKFGRNVAIYSSTIVVGAPHDDNEKGTDAGELHTPCPAYILLKTLVYAV